MGGAYCTKQRSNSFEQIASLCILQDPCDHEQHLEVPKKELRKNPPKRTSPLLAGSGPQGRPEAPISLFPFWSFLHNAWIQQDLGQLLVSGWANDHQ